MAAVCLSARFQTGVGAVMRRPPAMAGGRRIYTVLAIDRGDPSDLRDFIKMNISLLMVNVCAVQWVS